MISPFVERFDSRISIFFSKLRKWRPQSPTGLLARRIHGWRSLSVDFMRARVGVRRLAAPGFEVGSVGVWG